MCEHGHKDGTYCYSCELLTTITELKARLAQQKVLIGVVVDKARQYEQCERGTGYAEVSTAIDELAYSMPPNNEEN